MGQRNACPESSRSHNGTTGSESQGRGLCCESEDKQYRATSERSRSMKRIKFVGLDVHAETISVAVAEQDGEIRSLGMIANLPGT